MSRTLFLDRDGVINVKIDNDYVKSWAEFEFRQDFLKVVHPITHIFDRIIIVTNQKGIGRGLMTEDDLSDIHQKMVTEIKAHGGKIDAIYYCSHKSDDYPNRKPRIGMAIQAKHDFPDLRFSHSILIGDSKCDIQLAEQLNIQSVYMEYFLNF